MATYVVPQTLVFQDIDVVPAANLQPLPAHISGGHAHLIRHSEIDEKSFGSLGQYDPLADTDYAWPNRPTGGVVDQSYTKVFIDDALLLYFSDPIGAGDTIETVLDSKNRIKSAATNFKTNGAFARDVQFKERDVKIGDVAKVRAVVGPDTFELCTYVADFIADVVAAAVTTNADEDPANQATDLAAINSEAQTAGAINCVVETANGTAYDGLPDGDVVETYTVLVTQASAGGVGSTARLRVTSASGNDDQASVTPSAFGVATNIGTRGLTVTWTNTHGVDCSLSAENEGVDENDFVVGQTWEIEVAQAFTANIATGGGTFTGAVDDTYIVEVTRGGKYASAIKPQITVSTVKGLDVSGPHTVSDNTTPVLIGTKGVTVVFPTQTALCKGDRFYVVAAAASEGAIKTIVLGHNFAEEVITATDSAPVAIDLDLYIRKDIEVSMNRTEAAPLTNWEQAAVELTLNSGITAFDDSWTDGGVPEALPVKTECGYSNVYVTARYWESTLCNEVNGISNVSELEDAISGPLHPDNPLKWGVFKALQNANGRQVSYTAVCNPDSANEWANMLELLDGRRDIYGMVPLTRNPTVWSLFQAHISGQATPEFGRRRVAFFNAAGIPEKVMASAASSTDGEEILAVIEDDPTTGAVDYTYFRVPDNNGSFVLNGVAPGDIVRALFTTDGFGNDLYTEFVVDAVINESTLRVTTGHTVPVSTAQKIQVWRNLSATQQAAELALTNGFADRRINMVWPDQIGSDGYTVEGYHLCAALAGLISGVVPHQGLTRLEIAGFDDVSRTVDVFNRTQLNTMAAGGVWIVTQDPDSGDIFTRHAVTTGDTDVLTEREEMIVRNLDSISFFFLDTYEPYIGISNVTPSAIAILRAETHGSIKFLESANFVQRLGPQLILGDIVELRAHTTLKDRVVVILNLTLPSPLNNIEVHLTLVA